MTRDNYDVFFICKLNQVKQFNDFVLSFCVCIQKKNNNNDNNNVKSGDEFA